MDAIGIFLAIVVSVMATVHCQQGIPANIPANADLDIYKRLVALFGSSQRQNGQSNRNKTDTTRLGGEPKGTSAPITTQSPSSPLPRRPGQNFAGAKVGVGGAMHKKNAPILAGTFGVTSKPPSPATTSGGEEEGEGGAGSGEDGSHSTAFMSSLAYASGLLNGWNRMRVGPNVPAWTVFRVQRAVIKELKQTLDRLLRSGCLQFINAMQRG